MVINGGLMMINGDLVVVETGHFIDDVSLEQVIFRTAMPVFQRVFCSLLSL